MYTATLTVREWLDSCHGLEVLAGVAGLDPQLGSKVDLLYAFARNVQDRFIRHREDIRQSVSDEYDGEGRLVIDKDTPGYAEAQKAVEAVLSKNVTAPYPPLGITREELYRALSDAVRGGSTAPPALIGTWLGPHLVGEAGDEAEEELDRVFG